MMSCDLSTLWIVEEGRRLEEVVVYRKENQDGDADSQFPGARGLSINKPVTDTEGSSEAEASSPTCDLCICAQPPSQTLAQNQYCVITAVDVLCDARHMEVFSDCGEYVDTVRGIRVDEELGEKQKLFLIQYSFEAPVKKTTLRLASLLNTEKVWLHSIYITMDTVVSAAPASLLGIAGLGMTSFDMGKVKDRLSDMGTEVPDRAKGLLAAMESMQQKRQSVMTSGSSASAPPQMAALMAMFSAMKPSSSDTNSASSNSSQQPKPICDKTSTKPNHDIPVESTICQNDSDTSDHKLHGNTALCDGDNKQIGVGAQNVNSSLEEMLENMEERLCKQIQAVEQRLSAQVLEHISAAETRISTKLDLLLQKFSLHSGANPIVDSTDLD